MDSVNHSSSPTTFLCPRLRYKKQMDPETYFIEKQSDPSLEESHRLSLLDSDPDADSYFEELWRNFVRCGVCNLRMKHPTDLWCAKCIQPFHKECVESPPEIKVPYHPKHPLQVIFPSPKSTLQVRSSHYNKCNCCGENTHEVFYYSCSICGFNLHPVCAISFNILSINYPKRHDHTLTYFPRINSLTCDVCALSDDDKCFIYVCYQCDFVVHKTCIYLPNIIRISRHDHRLSFTPPLTFPNKNWYCGVCRHRVDKNYGQYSCVKDCDYVVHSKCATRKDLWDGEELEGEPDTEEENVKAFKEIGDGVIEHVSHPKHKMRLDKKENGKVEDGKRCQSCILPIYEGSIYKCMRCDFILHETCAHLPRKKWHSLHSHPLDLEVDQKREFECVACRNHCCGFAYTCHKPLCSFSLDVRCTLVTEPFTHEFHPHSLFLTSEEGISRECSMCGKQNKHLNCIECSFVFCFRCATLPYKVKYKYDEHYLTLSYKKDTRGYNWCDICEKETYQHVGFYTCNSLCSITLHIECLLGVDPFMNCSRAIQINNISFLIIPNDGLTRRICTRCRKHCPYRIVYKFNIRRSRMIFCSIECTGSYRMHLRNN